jgi:hypothetical protein
VYFPSPKSALPVLKINGEIEWITWGRRKEDDMPEFPNGGWARLDSIKEGKWQRYQPRPVLLPFNPLWKRIMTRPRMNMVKNFHASGLKTLSCHKSQLIAVLVYSRDCR